jgi:hypothetical protein
MTLFLWSSKTKRQQKKKNVAVEDIQEYSATSIVLLSQLQRQ